MIKINLPHDSYIEIHEKFFHVSFEQLKSEINWKQNYLDIQGKLIPFPRLTSYYGDYPYRYSGILNLAGKLPPTLIRISDYLNALGYSCNAVLCNLYRNGDDSIGWHSDDEREMPKGHCISSLSFGCSRVFKVKSRDRKFKQSFLLKNEDLLVMGGRFQQYYLHSIPKEENMGERINLTYRIIKNIKE